MKRSQGIKEAIAEQLSSSSGPLEDKVRWALESRELAIRMLALSNEKAVHLRVIREILNMLREFTGLQALGLFMCRGGVCSAVEGEELLGGFLAAENSMFNGETSDKPGDVPTSRAVLEGVSDDILLSRVDCSLPFFTHGGSFWTNSISDLLASPDCKYIRSRPTSSLKTGGYESIALVPVRSIGEIIGLLQFSDARRDCFSTESILFFEAIAAIIGIVIARISVEYELRRTNDELEARVKERTSDLLKANRLLEQEILERVEVQNRLLVSQQRLELAMRAANLGFWDWNISTGDVFYDQRWTDMLGYELDETDPHYSSWQALLHPSDKPKVLDRLKKAIKDPYQPYEIEYRLRTKSGEWRWLLDRGKVVERDQSGRALRMTGAYIDITDRKRMYEELHHSEERLRTIFENARDSIYIKDASLKYTHINPHFAAMLDLPESSIIGFKDRDLFGRDAAQILKEVDSRVLRGESIEQEHTRRVKDKPTTFLDIKVPMRDSLGEITGIFGISRDITDRKLIQSIPPAIGNYYRSPAMHSTLHAARLAAETDTIILLTGESGAGKDHVARFIHDHSKRAHGPFFSINCAAISPELFESELFGYESGAFTGARGPKRGLLELAEGGTILLNEIGELSLPLQSKLLTFLDSRQFTRVGGVKGLTVSARLIAATNRDLEQEVKRSRFRQDLFYRLNVFSIEVPPLRERIADLPMLVSDILQPIAATMGLDAVPPMDPDAMAVLESYHWPGNVRELRNILERALILCDKKRIRIGDLSINSKTRSRETDAEWAITVKFPQNQSLNDVTKDLKKRLVIEALARTGGRRKRAAELLGLTADALKHYMQTFDLY
jgi:PAS domain S-box-containing protein